MNSIFTMRRFSKGSSSKNVQSPLSPPVSYSPPQQPANDSRPVSSATSQDYDFTNRPISQPMSPPMSQSMSQPMSKQSQQLSSGMGLSRTDTVVLKHFWDDKYAENSNGRDLHYVCLFSSMLLHCNEVYRTPTRADLTNSSNSLTSHSTHRTKI